MKKLLITTCLMATIPAMSLGAENPMFDAGDQNSITFHVAQGTGSGTLLKLIQAGLWDFSPMTLFMLQYSQPTTVFRLPARINLTMIQNTAYRSASDLDFWGVGLSWDIAVLQWHGFYVGGGLGPYMRNRVDRWVESRLVFGEKVFIGKNVADHWRVELFTEHFSNGNFTDKNEGYNYFGIAANYSF